MENSATCVACGANWRTGQFSAGCQVCGGGAMERPCPACVGLCGSYWSREILDSNDFSLAHWRGYCRLPGMLERVAHLHDAGVSAEWWLDESALPTQLWACLIGAIDRNSLVLDMDGNEHGFARHTDACEWLREDEYDSLTNLRNTGKIDPGVKPPATMISQASHLLQKIRS